MQTVKELFPEVTVKYEGESDSIMLSEIGAKKYLNAYQIECSFVFPEDKIMDYIAIIQTGIKRDNIDIFGRGYIAGHANEFNGFIIVCNKKN